MRIYSKKAFCFQNPNVASIVGLDEKQLKQTLVHVRAMDFVEVPDWVVEDAMFNWAVQDGDIEVLDKKMLVGGAPVSPASEDVKDFQDMKAAQLYKLCVERGIECEERKSKDYYIELLEAQVVANEEAVEE
jgi:hypothetical protein